MTTIRLVLGDITTQEVDAIVNAANLEEVRFVLRDQRAYDVFAAERERRGV